MFEAEDFATCCGDVRELLYYDTDNNTKRRLVIQVFFFN